MSPTVTSCRDVIALLLAITSLLQVAESRVRLDYAVLEEQESGTLVGDLLQDANITDRTAVFQLRGGLNQLERRRFSVESRRGILRTAERLDREELCGSGVAAKCELTVDISVRMNQGSKSETIKVTVEILDINDNTPAFPDQQVTINIVESSPAGSLFLLPAATDTDAGRNGVREYQLHAARTGHSSDVTDRELPFELQVTEQSEGVKDVRLRLSSSLDREQRSAYQLVLTAVDGGEPQQTAQLNIHITVTDANDHAPRFERHEYHVTVNEDLAPGTSLIRVHATDQDHGSNGEVVYSFPDHVARTYGSVFRVDEETGVIYLRTSLDYERTSVYHLTVSATDMGMPPSLPVFAKVTVNVVDVNDNRPVIIVNVLTTSGSAEVRENTDAAGTFVAHIAARDADSGLNGRVECQLDDGGSQLFKLEPLFDVSAPSRNAEYKIVTLGIFDRELQAEYRLLLTCRDAASNTPLETSRELSVSILDENDNLPQLHGTSSGGDIVISVSENSSPGVELFRVNASDIDSGRNALLNYHIRALGQHTSTVNDVINIDRLTGRISAKVSFDYETPPREYRYLLTVSDSGNPVLSTTATVILVVTDTNDERPRFDRSAFYFSVSENQPPGTLIGRLAATDADVTSAFSRVVYDVIRPTGSSNGDGDAFEVDRETGEVRTARRLDREERHVYLFTVAASNEVDVVPRAGGDVTASTADVTVYVDDVNDNRPVFIFPGVRRGRTIDLTTPLSITVGSLVARLEASDADTGHNAEIDYSIASGNDDDAFDIDSSTGIITVGNGLAGRLQGGVTSTRLHRLVVVARDHGIPPFQAVADLTICVNETALVGEESSRHGAGGGTDVESKATVVIAGGAAIGGALTISCLLLAAILVCLVRRRRSRRRKQEILEKERRARDEVDRASSLGGASSCCQHRCSRSTSRNVIGAVLGSGVGYAREPGPGDDGSYSSYRDRRGSLQSSVSSSTQRTDHGPGCRCGSALDDLEPVPTLNGDVVENIGLQDCGRAGVVVVGGGGKGRSLGQRSTTDSGLAIDSPEQDHSRSPPAETKCPVAVFTDQPAAGDQRSASSCSKCRHHGGPRVSPDGQPRYRQQQLQQQHRSHHHHRCCSSGSGNQLHHHRHHRRQAPSDYTAVHRCKSWLPTVIPGQDPLQSDPRPTTTTALLTTSASCRDCRCDVDSTCSCTGSCADSGRGPSEEDDMTHSAAASAAAAAAKPLLTSPLAAVST